MKALFKILTLSTILVVVLVVAIGCTQDTVSDELESQPITLLRYIQPEELYFDLYLDNELVDEFTKKSFAGKRDEYLKIEIPDYYFKKQANGSVDVTQQYAVKIDYFIRQQGSVEFQILATGEFNKKFGSGDARLDPTDARFTYYNENSNELLDIHEYTASLIPNSDASIIRFLNTQAMTEEILVVPVGANLTDLIVAASGGDLPLYTTVNSEFQGNVNLQTERWYAFEAEREWNDNVCFGGVATGEFTSSLRSTLSQNILVFGEKAGKSFLTGLRASYPYKDLADVEFQGQVDSIGLLDDSIKLYLVPENTTGHLRAYVENDFSGNAELGRGCVFSLTSPPTLNQ